MAKRVTARRRAALVGFRVDADPRHRSCENGWTVIVALLASLTVLVVAQQRPGSETLRPEELFVHHEGLRITLHIPDTTLHIGQDPQLRLDFVNAGRNVLYLSPHVESNLYVTTANGVTVMPAMSGIADRFAPRRITPAELVALPPGGTWSAAVHPTRWMGDRYEAYAAHGVTKGSGWGLLLPPGRYLARFVYINAPDYGASYDPYEMPRGLWEGRLASDAVPFTVTAATPEQLAAERRRLGDGKGRPELSLLSVLSLSGPQLVEQFRTNPASRLDVLRAAQLRGERLAPALLGVLATLPRPDREMIRYSTEFSTLLRAQADCTIVRLLTGELRSTRGNAEYSMRPVFENAAPRCAGVRDQLRAIVADAAALPYGRSTAAALLGTFRDPADVSLLIEILDRRPSGNDDPLPRGAATGLARIGGPLARQALVRALGDDRRNYLLGPEFVSRLRTIGGTDAAAALLAALSAKNDNIVVSALSGIPAAADHQAAPRLRELIKHSNPTIRSYAAGAIRRSGGTAARDVMRSALSDRDHNVQQQALFYLAEHGDSSDLPAFVTHLTSPEQYVREAASAGIARFGTAATFPQLRQLVQGGDAGDPAARAIAALAFTGIVPRRTPQQWDQWYAAHRDRSRVEWARAAVEALAVLPLEGGGWQLSAISYLADQGPATYRQDFERAAASLRPAVRVEAARAIARVDRARAAALLFREFAGRLVRGCEAANRALNQLAGQRRTVVCTDPADRQRAAADWARQQF